MPLSCLKQMDVTVEMLECLESLWDESALETLHVTLMQTAPLKTLARKRGDSWMVKGPLRMQPSSCDLARARAVLAIRSGDTLLAHSVPMQEDGVELLLTDCDEYAGTSPHVTRDWIMATGRDWMERHVRSPHIYSVFLGKTSSTLRVMLEHWNVRDRVADMVLICLIENDELTLGKCKVIVERGANVECVFSGSDKISLKPSHLALAICAAFRQ